MPKLFSLCLLLLSFPASSQVAVELERMNVIYIGLRNPVNILVQGHDKKDLVYETGEGCALIQTDSGDYFTGYQRGDCKFLIKTKKGKLLDSSVLRVRSIPKPETRLGVLESGIHTQGSIQAQNGVYATLGEGFAYEGVKYLVDSCIITLLTPFEFIQCCQKGTALHPVIKSHIGNVLELSISNIYVSPADSGAQLQLAPIVLETKQPILNELVRAPDFSEYPLLPTGSCRIERNIELTYSSDGHENRIRSEWENQTSSLRFLHMRQKDTVSSVNDHYYKGFNDSGNLVEAGFIGIPADTIIGRLVYGEAFFYPNSSISFENDTTLALRMSKRFYPIGEWAYYHDNGNLKAKGRYRFNNVVKSDECIVTIDKDYHYARSYVIHILRTGTWLFYNQNGDLIHTIHYSE